MEDLLEKLINILNQEYENGKKLINILEEKKNIMKSTDIKKINEKVKEEQSIIYKIFDLEDERTKIIVEIADKLNMQPEELTISSILKIDGINRSILNRMNELKVKISNVFKQITKLSEINKYLIERSLLFIEDRIKVIKHAMAINKSNIVDKKI